MALLAEEIVEEWLNRQGYFTIRGIKLGVNEIDLLAVKPSLKGSMECRHIEVQASMRPVSYISPVPKEIRKQGKSAYSASRSSEELVVGVKEWIDKKFLSNKKKALMQSLWPEEWTSELVLNVIKSDPEVELIRGHGIKIIWLKDIITSLADEKFPVKSAAGADLIDLINMGAYAQQVAGSDQ
jgi:hypothetical protein